MVPDHPIDRRTVLKTTGGLLGASAVSGAAMAQQGTESGGQQPLDKRIGMLTTGGQNFYTVPIRWVEQGTTVVWQLVGGTHSTTAYAAANDKPNRIPSEAESWDSAVLTQSGATFERQFTVPGVYDYFCRPHEGLGMVGRLVVGSPDLSTLPALAEPQDSLPTAAQNALSALNALTRVVFG